MRASPETSRGTAEALPEPEFSRPFAVDKLGQQAAVVDVEAKPAERQALARRFDLQTLDALSADLRLERACGGGLVRVTGRLQARGAQTCVVTLDPVPFTLDQEVGLVFAPASDVADQGEVVVEAEGEDAPEPFVDGAIDLGEAMAQTLAVALDPYPRAPGASLERSEFGPHGQNGTGEAEAATQESPFAALRRLRGDVGAEEG